jgi:uncharacterized membrane protein
MHLDLVTQAPLAVRIHLATVLPAFVIVTWLIFFSAPSARLHRALGAVHLALMTTAAAAASFIRTIDPGHLSLVHLFVPSTLSGVFGPLWNVRRGNTRGIAMPWSGSISAAC